MFAEKIETFDRGAMELMGSISDRISQFSGICRDVRRLTSGLELTRIMCKIERSKLTSGTEGLDEIINRLTDAQDRISKALTKIEDASSEITSLVSTLNGQNTKA
jgi:aerotaxis receptor